MVGAMSVRRLTGGGLGLGAVGFVLIHAVHVGAIAAAAAAPAAFTFLCRLH